MNRYTVSAVSKQLSIMKKQAKKIDDQICDVLSRETRSSLSSRVDLYVKWNVRRFQEMVWFTEGFVIDTQLRLDEVNDLIVKINQIYHNKINRIDYRLGGKITWRDHVGPRSSVLPVVHDGDINWVVIDVIMEDYDLR